MSIFYINLDINPVSYHDQLNRTDTLCNIKLDSDIIFIYKSEYIRYSRQGFRICNVSTMKLDDKKYILPLSIIIPSGYIIMCTSLINGIRVNYFETVNIYHGFEINIERPITDQDILRLDKSTPDYTIHHNTIIHFDEFNRQLIAGNKTIVGNLINPKTDIFTLNIIPTATGLCKPINNCYFIKSNQLYQSIPQF